MTFCARFKGRRAELVALIEGQKRLLHTKAARDPY
jgi:hypothetical protein